MSNLITANYDSEGNQSFDPQQNPEARKFVTVETDELTGMVKNLVVAGRDLMNDIGVPVGRSHVTGIGSRRPAAVFLNQTAYPGRTWGLKIEFPVKTVCAVRFAVLTSPTAAQSLIGCVGPMAAWGSNHNASEYVASTWNNGESSVSVPQKANGIPDHVWSDWIPVTETLRTDTVGANAIVGLRVYSASGDIMTSGQAAADSGFSSVPLKYHTGFGAGDYVTSGQNGFGAGGNPSCCPIAQVEYLTREGKVWSIAEYSDSIGQGYGGTLRGNGPLVLSCDVMNASGKYVSPIMQGYPGDPVNGFIRRFRSSTANRIGLPDIALFRPYSRNDGGGTRNGIALAQAFIAECRALGIKPVLITGFYESSNTAYNTPMQTVNSATRSMAAAHGVPVIDLEPIITAANSATYLADGIHPNNAGNALLEPAYTTVLQAMVS